MVKIRLVRVGRRHKPSYRIMVADSKSANNGRFIENIGHFNPRTEPESIVVKADRAVHWLSQGAQPSAAVARILKREDIVDENGALRQTEAKAAEPETGAGLDDAAAVAEEPTR